MGALCTAVPRNGAPAHGDNFPSFLFAAGATVDVQQYRLASPDALDALQAPAGAAVQLVLVFGAPRFFEHPRLLAALRRAFGAAPLLGCSTAGEIGDDGVGDDGCVITTLRLRSTQLFEATTRLAAMADSYDAGVRLGAQLAPHGVKAVIAFAPGVAINGSALVDGLGAGLGATTPVSGGLAGDSGSFVRTWTLGSNGVSTDEVVAIGLRGADLEFSHGSFGGWKAFGPVRRITGCAENVLTGIDGEPALDVYERLLGEHAAGLPATGLRYPFAIFDTERKEFGPIRTILGVDRARRSLTLAGAVQPASFLMLMHATHGQLVDGARAAAGAARKMRAPSGDTLAILVSCIGRKLVMADRIGDEIAAVRGELGARATLAGFYAYGEIGPFRDGATCLLHNQSMTTVWLGER